tara:strand:- start:21 stop:161 length:141 start_codon:yes stop_codon:yes gene_type:complete
MKATAGFSNVNDTPRKDIKKFPILPKSFRDETLNKEDVVGDMNRDR